MNAVLAERLEQLCDRDNPFRDLLLVSKDALDEVSNHRLPQSSKIQIETVSSTSALAIFCLVATLSSSMNRDNMPSD